MVEKLDTVSATSDVAVNRKKRRYFGTDGIRGVAGAPPLDPFTMVRLGKALGRVFLRGKGRHRVLIGKDTRLSGYMIETSLAAGITSVGVDVLLVGPLPTAGVAYLTKSMRADAGVMISASHNPFEDNGIKVFGADGYKLPDSLELELESHLEPGDLDEVATKAGEIGKAARIDDAVGRYTVFLKNAFPRELTLEGLRVGFDCANGAAYVVGPQTFSELGADVSARGVSPNGKNINAGFGSLYPQVMSKLVVEQNLDLGIALDGDADRAILVDEKGKVLDGDMLLAICARDLHERGLFRERRVVGTIMSNLGLERVLEPLKIGVERAPVGDRYVLEAMQRVGAQLGGEQSGHLISLDHSTTGDGILTALLVAAVVCRTGKPLSELNSSFVQFPQKLISVPVARKPEFSEVESIDKVIRAKQEELSDIGRLVVRYSGTENTARIMVECEERELCESLAMEVAEVIEKELGVS